LSSYSNVDEQVICPLCLEESPPRDASTFMWNSVYAAATSGNSHVHCYCMSGHRIDSNLICGTRTETRPTHVQPQNVAQRLVADVLESVVIVGLWDPSKNAIVNAGSGFIVNRKLGLIVTAGHTLFTFTKGANFGTMHMGIPNAKVVIGVIVDDNHTAAFRYWAEIVTHDIHRVDACVLRIVSRMENDVADDGAGCATQTVTTLSTNNFQEQNLKALKVTKSFEILEAIRILGFNQGGEGLFKKGTHVNRVADIAVGYVCKKFETARSDDGSSSSSSSGESETERQSFAPQKEIVVICPTISGHSGGPCVNNEGKVIGILSRSDPVETSRCYLVPAMELKRIKRVQLSNVISRTVFATKSVDSIAKSVIS
jgi:Trypsin-like peptidase domain